MTQKRIMLLGAAGQVGQALLHQSMPADWTIRGYSRAECDITNHRAVRDAVQEFQPDLVINSAAMTAVDLCEKEPDLANAINFEGPANLAAQCATVDAPLIHISTDYVFDGKDGETPYKPDDAMNPPNVYGQSKMMGEEAVRHGCAWHVILRVSWVFSEFSNTNILAKALQMIDKHDALKLVTDVVAGHTYAPEIAKAIITMGSAILKGKTDGFGTFHLCGTPPANRFEFTQAVMEEYAPHTSRRPQISPAQSSDFPGFAPRPPYSVLDCQKILDVYGIKQAPWLDGLHNAVTAFMKQRQTS